MRAPFQVLVYLYRTNEVGEFEYAIFLRADMGIWQGVAGGGEEGESPQQAAKRETAEEAGLLISDGWTQLQTVGYVPRDIFFNSDHWPEDLYVIPIYCFGVLTDGAEVTLSHEHTRMRWLSFKEAQERVKFDSDRTALWELNERLQRVLHRPLEF